MNPSFCPPCALCAFSWPSLSDFSSFCLPASPDTYVAYVSACTPFVNFCAFVVNPSFSRPCALCALSWPSETAFVSIRVHSRSPFFRSAALAASRRITGHHFPQLFKQCQSLPDSPRTSRPISSNAAFRESSVFNFNFSSSIFPAFNRAQAFANCAISRRSLPPSSTLLIASINTDLIIMSPPSIPSCADSTSLSRPSRGPPTRPASSVLATEGHHHSRLLLPPASKQPRASQLATAHSSKSSPSPIADATSETNSPTPTHNDATHAPYSSLDRNHTSQNFSPFTNPNAGTSSTATSSNNHFRISRYSQEV